MSVTFKNLSWATSGLFSGGGIIGSFRGVQSVKQGNTDFTAWKQAGNISSTIAPLFHLLNDLKVSDFSKSKRKWIVRLIAYPLPFALQILNHHVDAVKHPTLKRNINFVRDHIEHVTVVIEVIVMAVFSIYASPYYALGAAIGFTVELAVEKKWVSPKVKQVWEKVSVVLPLMHVLSIGFVFDDVDPWDIFHYLSWMGIFGYETYLQKNEAPPITHRLTLEKGKELIKHPEKLEIDFSHLYFDPKVSVPGSASLNIEMTIKEMIESFNWTEKHLHTFKEKLLRDSRFQKEHPEKKSLQDIPDDLAKQIFATRLTKLGHEIANSAIAKGDSFIPYTLLQDMLKSVLKTLQGSKNIEDDLFILSIEGGDFCGVGEVGAINKVYDQRVLGKEGQLPLRNKFLHQLVEYRKEKFDQIYARLTLFSNKLPKGIVDLTDTHFNNAGLFYFDKALKLHSAVLKSDMNTQDDGFFFDRTYRFFFSLFMDQTYWRHAVKSWYNSITLSKEVASKSQELGIGAQKISEWWTEWAEKQAQHADEDFKEDMIMMKFFGEDLQVCSHKEKKFVLNEKLILLMLFDMGILKEKG